MLWTNAKYVYFFLVWVFVFLCWVSLTFPWDTLWNNFIYLFTILLIPVFDYIINTVWKEFDRTVFWFDSSTLLKALLFIILSGVVYSLWYSLYASMTILFLVLFLLFNLGFKIPFFVALVLFLYSAIYIVSGNTQTADTLSIYAYYYLIIGVVLQVYHFYLIKLLPSEQQ